MTSWPLYRDVLAFGLGAIILLAQTAVVVLSQGSADPQLVLAGLALCGLPAVFRGTKGDTS